MQLLDPPGAPGDHPEASSQADEVYTDPTALEQLDPEYVAWMQSLQWREPYGAVGTLAAKTAEVLGIDYVTALRLEKEKFRGRDYSAYRAYLTPGRALIRSPEETVEGMEAAAGYLRDSLSKGEKLAVFCDYDVDGVSSAAVFRRALESVGADLDGQVLFEYASAKDGFGLTQRFVTEAHQWGARTLVTLDCGSAGPGQLAAIKHARELGMKVIVIDHHNIQLENTADFHLNPRYQMEKRQHQAKEALDKAKQLLERSLAAKQARLVNPDDPDVQAELDECVTLSYQAIAELDGFSEASPPSKTLPMAIERLEEAIPGMITKDENTGAQLAWKFGAALQQAYHGEVLEFWYEEAMYLAANGAIGDRASLADLETRAFCRIPVDPQLDPDELREHAAQQYRRLLESLPEALRDKLTEEQDEKLKIKAQRLARFAILKQRVEHRRNPAPVGIRMLAEHFDEDPTDLASLVRTRAVLNLAKRTPKVDAADAVQVLCARTPEEAKPAMDRLLAVYEDSVSKRKEMLERGLQDWEKRAAGKGDEEGEIYFASAVIRGYPDYVGQSGIIAAQMSKQVGLPAIVFTEKGEDAEGKPVYKFSARNEVVRSIEIGELLESKRLQKACEVASVDEHGEVHVGPSLGGHPNAVSGVCREENIDKVVQILESFGERKAKRSKNGWMTKDKSKVWVTKRLVDPEHLELLEREAQLIKPTDSGTNYPTRVSIAARAEDIGELDPDTNSAPATLVLPNGARRRCRISPDALPAMQTGAFFEVAISLGDREYWVGKVRPIPQKKQK